MTQTVVRFNCPRCNKQCSAPAALAGRSISCQCGAKYVIPSGTQNPPPPSRPLQPSPSPQPTGAARATGGTPPAGAMQQGMTQQQPSPPPGSFSGGTQQPTKFCFACGQSIDARAEMCPKCGVRQPGALPGPGTGTGSGKNRLVAALLALFLGGLGVHHFYLGRPLLGVLYLLFCWTFIPALIALIEGLVLLCTSDESFHRTYATNVASAGPHATSGHGQQKSGGNGCLGALAVGAILLIVGFLVLQGVIDSHNRRRQEAIDRYQDEADRALRDAERALEELRNRR